MSLLFAYASFALACVLGVTYALLFKEIKAKQLGFFYTRLPPLASLDLMNSRAITVGWMFPDDWCAGRRHLGVASERAPRSAGAGDVDRRPQDPCRAGVVGDLLVRALRAESRRLERPARRAISRGRLRDRPAEFCAGRVLPDGEPQFLVMRLFAVGLSHRTAPVELRESVDFARKGSKPP